MDFQVRSHLKKKKHPISPWRDGIPMEFHSLFLLTSRDDFPHLLGVVTSTIQVGEHGSHSHLAS